MRNITGKIAVAVSLGVLLGTPAFAEVDLRNLLKDGLLGAGVGAISAETSGGKAGKGALIGAGTHIIGGALLGFLTEPSGGYKQVTYAEQYYPATPVQAAPVYAQQPAYAPAYSYAQAPSDPNKAILKSGLLGAGVGAISASASGGSMGTGALVGAGTNVIGGAVLDFLTTPSAPSYQQPAAYYPVQSYYGSPQQQAQSAPLHKKIIRKYDSEGKLLSEEETWE